MKSWYGVGLLCSLVGTVHAMNTNTKNFKKEKHFFKWFFAKKKYENIDDYNETLKTYGTHSAVWSKNRNGTGCAKFFNDLKRLNFYTEFEQAFSQRTTFPIKIAACLACKHAYIDLFQKLYPHIINIDMCSVKENGEQITASGLVALHVLESRRLPLLKTIFQKFDVSLDTLGKIDQKGNSITLNDILQEKMTKNRYQNLKKELDEIKRLAGAARSS